MSPQPTRRSRGGFLHCGRSGRRRRRCDRQTARMLEKVLLALGVLATVAAVLALIGGADPADLAGFAVVAAAAAGGILVARERRGRD